MNQNHQNFEELDIKTVLSELGYHLLDFGDHWRAQAVYRGGDNPMSLQIYKNTGVWKDYARGGSPQAFKKLLVLSGEKDTIILEKCKISHTPQLQQEEKITMDRIYPEESLSKLFPNFNFYLSKNISENTQRFFQTGLASNGKMYRRMVFPIRDEHRQIFGFSGRAISDEHPIKWKHLGRKTNWVYPVYLDADLTVDKAIEETKEVFLVESIGDAMALFDQGIRNIIVIFGTSVSSAVVNYLNTKELNKIHISTNNDALSKDNNGVIAAIKALMKLSTFFDVEKLDIKLPPKPHNDFGKAHEAGVDLVEWSKTKIDQEQLLTRVRLFIKNHPDDFKKDLVKTFFKTLS